MTPASMKSPQTNSSFRLNIPHAALIGIFLAARTRRRRELVEVPSDVCAFLCVFLLLLLFLFFIFYLAFFSLQRCKETF